MDLYVLNLISICNRIEYLVKKKFWIYNVLCVKFFIKCVMVYLNRLFIKLKIDNMDIYER